MTVARIMLRSALATLAYRVRRALLNASASVANYRCGESSLTGVETIAHMGDLMDWGLSMAEGQQKWHHSTPLAWDKECERFFAALKRLDDYLASEKPLQVSRKSYPRDLWQMHSLTPARSPCCVTCWGRSDKRGELLRGRNHRRTSRQGPGPAARGV